MKEADQIPAAWQVYRHFKGNLYQVLTLALKEDTGEQLVIYQALYPPYRIYARSLESFTSEVDHEKYPDAQQRLRFELVTDDREYRQSADRAAGENIGTDIKIENVKQRVEQIPADTAAEQIEAFLDCDSAAGRMEILRSLRPQLTDRMVDTLAMGAGVDVAQGPLDRRIDDLMNCLQTVARYETDRSRFRT